MTTTATGNRIYFNYEEYVSIILMALVDSNYEFLFVDVGINGRVHYGT